MALGENLVGGDDLTIEVSLFIDDLTAEIDELMSSQSSRATKTINVDFASTMTHTDARAALHVILYIETSDIYIYIYYMGNWSDPQAFCMAYYIEKHGNRPDRPSRGPALWFQRLFCVIF